MTVDFWRQELDFALIGGILGGVHGKSAVIDRIQKLWPRLDSKMLHERLEALADHGTPPWAKPEFWTGALKELLLEGARGGLTAERKAIGKILHLHPELRPRVVGSATPARAGRTAPIGRTASSEVPLDRQLARSI